MSKEEVWANANVASQTYNPTFVFDKSGQSFVGILKEVKEVTTKAGREPQKKYVFDTISGVQEIWGSATLDTRFVEGGEKGQTEPNLPTLVGKIVKITFKGHKDNNDEKSLKLFDVVWIEDTEENRVKAGLVDTKEVGEENW